ncbi:MAG: acyl carrier protein [Myxococcota bacterium]
MTDLQPLLRFLDEYLGVRAGPDDDLFAAGLDSVQIAEVIAFLELRFGVKVPDAAVTTEAFSTPRRILSLVGQLQHA